MHNEPDQPPRPSRRGYAWMEDLAGQAAYERAVAKAIAEGRQPPKRYRVVWLRPDGTRKTIDFRHGPQARAFRDELRRYLAPTPDAPTASATSRDLDDAFERQRSRPSAHIQDHARRPSYRAAVNTAKANGRALPPRYHVRWHTPDGIQHSRSAHTHAEAEAIRQSAIERNTEPAAPVPPHDATAAPTSRHTTDEAPGIA